VSQERFARCMGDGNRSRDLPRYHSESVASFFASDSVNVLGVKPTSAKIDPLLPVIL